MIDYVFELPHDNLLSGGVRHTIGVATAMGAHIRFQRLIGDQPPALSVPISVGPPDRSFPACRYAVTYSDSQSSSILTSLSQVRKVGVWMLSYGMSLDRERANALNPKLTVMTSTNRTKRLLDEIGARSTCVGFGFETDEFYPDPDVEREHLVALFCHPRDDKRFNLAVKIANQLYGSDYADGFATFGHKFGVDLAFPAIDAPWRHHRVNASPRELADLFNRCSVFIMPSITEGLNRTPAEATLCGCPAVLCDGAIDDLYVPDWNCKWVERDNEQAIREAAIEILNMTDEQRDLWRVRTLEKLEDKTFENVAVNIRRAMETPERPVIEVRGEPKVSIVIPFHSQQDLLDRCIDSIRAKTHNQYEIIVVDDGSPQEVNDEKLNFFDTVVRHDKPLGFSQSCNSGLRQASPDSSFFILLNSDTEIGTDGWVQRLIKAAQDNPTVGIFSPVSNNAKMQSIPSTWGGPLPSGHTPSSFAELLDTLTEHRHPRASLLHGYCYIIRKETRLAVGMFDEEMFPHYGSEDDYSLRAKIAGWDGMILDDVFVYHVGSASYSSAGRTGLAKDAGKLLREKYGEQVIDSLVAKDGGGVEYLREKFREMSKRKRVRPNIVFGGDTT